ncbi:MAG: alpha-2-macroglobulin family protein [Fimbriimonadaceae bacterium]
MTPWGRLLGIALAVGLAVWLLAVGITREVPRGSVRGTIVMKENGRPLPKATLWFSRVDALAGEEGASDGAKARTDSQGAFELRGLATGEYEVYLTARAHRLPDKLRVLVTEGKATEVAWQAEPVESFLEVYRSQLVVVPGESATFEVHGFADAKELDLAAYELDVDEVAKRGGLQDALSPLARRGFDAVSPSDASVARPVRRERLPVRNRDAEGVFIEMVRLEGLPEGLYYVELRAADALLATFSSVSRLAMIAKNDGRRIEVLATDIVTGRPVEGVELGASSKQGQSSEVTRHGRTDESGRATIEGVRGPSPVVFGQKGRSAAFVGNLWNYDEPGGSLRVHWQTDRPIYRPGDQIFFKAFVRRREGASLAPPANLPVLVEWQNEEGDVLERLQLSTDEMGAFSGSVATLPESAPGYYRLHATVGGEKTEEYVQVAAYPKPEIEVAVQPQAGTVVFGGTARVGVVARYFFGAPVAGARVTLTVFREPVWPVDPAFADADSEWQGGAGGEFVTDLEGVTDATGRCWFDVPTVQEGESGAVPDTDFVYRLSAFVKPSDLSFVSGEGRFRAVRGDIDLRCVPGRQIGSVGAVFPVDVVALDHEGGSREGVRVLARLEKVLWIGNKERLQTLETLEGRTDASGRATLEFRPRFGGMLRVVAEATDSAGRKVSARTELWVEGGEPMDVPVAPSLAVMLDKREYSDRDTARALIRTSRPGGTALVALESDRIHRAWTVDLDQPVTAIDVPLGPELKPNAFLSVAYVREKAFAEASRVLRISKADESLEIRVTPKSRVYQPGETAEFEVQTLAAGKPVSADACFALVDEAVFSIREDDSNILASFYPNRYNRVVTGHSFPELYLDGGDKGPAGIRLRRDFRDTAYWQANLRTGPDGRATVPVRLPDNLTQWRATVVGATADSKAGKGIAKVRVRKPLMVRLSAPRLLVEGDRLPLIGTVTNETGRDQSVQVSLFARGIDFQGRSSLVVRVPAGGEQAIRWELRARRPGQATLAAKAWVEGGPDDGVEAQTTILAAGRLTPWRVSGQADGSAVQRFEWDDASPTGWARVTITPDARWAMVQALDELIDYPYGCVEQTLSRFVPAAVAGRLAESGRAPAFRRRSDIPRIVASGFARLSAMQGPQGGWGWWAGEKPDPTMTAMALEGLAWAAQAGYEPPKSMVGSALQAATQLLSGDAYWLEKDDRLQPEEAAYLAGAVLMHAPRDPSALAAVERLDPAKLSPTGLSHAALACHSAGLPQLRDRFLQALRRAARGGDVRYWVQEGSFGVEPTARALLAIAQVDPYDPWIAPIARYLMLQRRGTGWMSTRDTAATVLALANALRGPLPVLAGRRVAVRVNGIEVGRLSLGDLASGAGSLRFELSRTSLKQGTNELQVESEAPVYWSLETLQSVRSNLSRPVAGRGLQVSREYSLVRLETTSEGYRRALPDRGARTTFARGDTVLCRITLQATRDARFVVVEDPLPAGWTVLNSNEESPTIQLGDLWPQMEVRDDRVAFFLADLPKGRHTISYLLRPELDGVAHALPTSAYGMYDPDDRAGGPMHRLEVRGR